MNNVFRDITINFRKCLGESKLSEAGKDRVYLLFFQYYFPKFEAPNIKLSEYYTYTSKSMDWVAM